MCKRSVKHMADATTWGRLERIVRWRWMPMNVGPWCTCRKPKREGPDAHLRTFSQVSPKRLCQSRSTCRANHCFRSRPTQSMQCVSALDRIDRRSNAAGNIPKSNANRSRESYCVEKQSHQTLFCRLTPELSRPVAGRQTRASVAQSTRLTPRHGVGLNELLAPSVQSVPCVNERPNVYG